VFALDPGPWRFNDLRSRLDVSPTTLSERLSELADLGVLDRRSYDEIPSRVEYSPAAKGRALRPILESVGERIGEYGGYGEHDGYNE
jgi:DNA-binding HxlR family transcriptional regulator